MNQSKKNYRKVFSKTDVFWSVGALLLYPFRFIFRKIIMLSNSSKKPINKGV